MPIAPFVAATCGRAADTITSEIVLEAQVPGDVLAPWVVVAKPGTGEVVVVHTRLDDGSLLRTVRVRDDGRARVGSADLETARPLSVDDAPQALRGPAAPDARRDRALPRRRPGRRGEAPSCSP